jgi:energy-coupling factor transporter ATP-binding protein EcfA2
VPAAELAELLAVKRPYPGLRPFEENEAFLFFGRQIHTDELLKRLSAGRFLAVIGTSGSGKSSLVRAGLLPALHRGFLTGATSRWRIAIMRPGHAPLDNLAKSLAEAKIGPPNVQELVHRSSQGFTEAIRQTQLAPGESVLVVVDQFEELFRFERERRSQDGGAEASLFVSSLLEASDAFGVSVYVVITMRSDFLGDCTQFSGLAEALNTSQYLIPRHTREQRREAIERPLQIVGANMTPRLVQRLLNDLGDAQDQLPVLQHALNRTFSKWKEAGSVGDIDFEHYEAAGELIGALDRHADDILKELPPDQQEWVERVFRCLTMFEGGRAIRRPARFDRLCSVASGGPWRLSSTATAIPITRYSSLALAPASAEPVPK